jgi:hypothetical protein
LTASRISYSKVIAAIVALVAVRSKNTSIRHFGLGIRLIPIYASQYESSDTSWIDPCQRHPPGAFRKFSSGWLQNLRSVAIEHVFVP